jgi:hypothetical protein
MKTQQAVITAIKKVLDKGDIECPAFSQPLFLWINSIYQLTATPPPQLNDDMLFNIVLAMLGIAGLRTYEKQKGLTK